MTIVKNHRFYVLQQIRAYLQIPVQQPMFFSGKKMIVQLANCRVLLGETDIGTCVCIVHTFHTAPSGSWACAGWLTTTHDTSSSARHNLNEIIACFAGSDTVKQPSCICKTMYNCDLHFSAI